MTAPDVQLRTVPQPGDLGAIIRMHGLVYADEYGWDHSFEAAVAQGLAAFTTKRDDDSRLWIAARAGAVAGCIAIVGQGDGTALVRWFLVDPECRGLGIGRRLLDAALAFCRERGFRSVFLWTAREMAAAAHLYRDAGFRMTEEATNVRFGTTVVEQRYELPLADS